MTELWQRQFLLPPPHLQAACAREKFLDNALRLCFFPGFDMREAGPDASNAEAAEAGATRVLVPEGPAGALLTEKSFPERVAAEAMAAQPQEATERCMLHLLFMLLQLSFAVLRQNACSNHTADSGCHNSRQQLQHTALTCSFDITLPCSSTCMLCCFYCSAGSCHYLGGP